MSGSSSRLKFLDSIKALRETLQVDKADLDVVSVEGDTARVNLVIGEGACPECVLTKEMLVEMLLMVARDSCPEIKAVEVNDPRESAAFTGHH
jgi:hypothetical protein